MGTSGSLSRIKVHVYKFIPIFVSNYKCGIIIKLADAKEVVEAVKNLEAGRLPVLTPNLKVCNVHPYIINNRDGIL